MRFYLISDNVDTQLGLRLAGIDGVVVHEPAAVERELGRAIADERSTKRYHVSRAVILVKHDEIRICPHGDSPFSAEAKHGRDVAVGGLNLVRADELLGIRHQGTGTGVVKILHGDSSIAGER